MQRDLTRGKIAPTLLSFALPMIAGNLLQQLYNVADTLIVGQVLGANALAAVGSSYTLMVFLTSILLGLCMGAGSVFSMQHGAKDTQALQSSVFASFVLIGGLTALLNLAAFVWIDPIMRLLQVDAAIYADMRAYLYVIFWGIGFTFLYNYFACLLRALGNSLTPLLFLAVSAALNIGLDLLFVMGFHWGVAGAAIATVIAQGVSGIGIGVYCVCKMPLLRISRSQCRLRRQTVREIAQHSVLTCLQQSVMNFGILMIQGLVNSFGVAVTAAFAAAVKIDSFAYMPVQDFGNAFSTFIAQNHGARQSARIRAGIRSAALVCVAFCAVISTGVCVFAHALMRIFVQAHETQILAIGVQYLRIEGACYLGIGVLFLLYGYFRAVNRPGMSLVLTVLSLGTRVGLAYLLAPLPAIGLLGIWWAIPIGWFLADAVGLWCCRRNLHVRVAPAAVSIPKST